MRELKSKGARQPCRSDALFALRPRALLSFNRSCISRKILVCLKYKVTRPRDRYQDCRLPRRFITAFRDLFPGDFPSDKSGRLQPAQAISSPRNPLTSRVIVKRILAWHFGELLVGSPSDFGFRGEKPENQPLLDNLAAWFMAHGWSFKKLHKYQMLTETYRRSGFPVRPLELEPYWDSVIAVSGGLDLPQFGKPLQDGTDKRRTL